MKPATLDTSVMLDPMNVSVNDNPAENRYEVFAGGERAGFVQYRIHDNRITMVHTEVDPSFEGLGLGSKLAKAALEDVRKRGLELVPLCPFISAYIRRHPDEYLDLVVPDLRDKVMGNA